MERISSIVQRNNGLTGTSGQLVKRLPHEESLALGVLLAQTAKRYPNQELEESMGEYLADYEQLSMKYSLQKVEDAVAALRIDPEQHFFPTPDEVAHKIEQTRLKSIPSHLYARG